MSLILLLFLLLVLGAFVWKVYQAQLSMDKRVNKISKDLQHTMQFQDDAYSTEMVDEITRAVLERTQGPTSVPSARLQEALEMAKAVLSAGATGESTGCEGSDGVCAAPVSAGELLSESKL
jgi:hypothetical protein